MSLKKNVYESVGALNCFKDERYLKITQKAKSFGIDMFENETLAKEFFNLEIHENVNKEVFKEFRSLLGACEQAILRAQMSS